MEWIEVVEQTEEYIKLQYYPEKTEADTEWSNIFLIPINGFLKNCLIIILQVMQCTLVILFVALIKTAREFF